MSKPNRLFSIVLTLASIGQVSADLYLPSMPAISQQLMTHIDWVQFSMSVFLIGFALSQLFYGPVSDGIGRKKPLLTGLLLLLSGGLICMSATNITWFIVGRTLQGLGAGSCITLSRAILRDLYAGTLLARYASYMLVGSVVFMACAPLLGGYIQHVAHWRGNFIFLSLLTATFMLVVFFFLPETNSQQDRNHMKLRNWLQHLNTLARNNVFLSMSVLVFMAYAGILAWLSAGTVLMQQQAGLTPIQFGWTTVATGTSYGIGGVINAALVQRLGLQRMLTTGLILMLIGSSTMLALYGIQHNVTVWNCVPPIMVYMMGTSFIFANAYASALTPFAHIAGIAGSIFGCTQILGGAVSSALIARTIDVTQLPTACVLLGTALISLCVFTVARQLTRRS